MTGRKSLGGILVAALLVASCAQRWQAEFAGTAETQQLDRTAPYLKVHLSDGGVVTLRGWWINRHRQVVHGTGIHYDAERSVVRRGRMVIPFDRVVLFETNRPRDVAQPTHVTLGVLGGVVGATVIGVVLYCALEPKACFGSCPTFYVDGADGEPVIQAEGFSSAIARAFEDTDVDALPAARADGGPLVIEMRNEALETHVVDSVRLLAVPRVEGRRVVRSGTQWFDVVDEQEPVHCRADAPDDCLDGVRSDDGHEWHTTADRTDLGAQMTLELELPPGAGPRGLLLSARHSLVQTFVLYQFLAWVGGNAGDMYAAFERGAGTDMRQASQLGREIGSLHVEVLAPDGTWQPAGSYEEVGPIARDPQVVRLPDGDASSPLRVRIRMSRGWWRIDRLAAVTLGAERTPITIAPREVRRLREGGSDVDAGALSRLQPGGEHLITLPGDAYTLEYDVPPGAHDVFLESRGYYYEWVRAEWLTEESPDEVLRFLLDPRAALRRLAPAFGEIEGEMDRLFWGSRFGTPRRVTEPR